MSQIPAGWVLQADGSYSPPKKIKSNENNFLTVNTLPDAKQRELKKTLARSDEGKAPGAGLLHCRFTLRRKSLLDVDAKYASVKDLLDCLVFSGIIPGDKEGQITLQVEQEKVKLKSDERTVIEII